MRYPIVTLAVARLLRKEGRPWKVRLEFVGRNSGNQSGHSSKYWEMYSDGDDFLPVKINYGKIGSAGLMTPQSKTFDEAVAVYGSKLDKGYQSYRGSAASLDRVPGRPSDSAPVTTPPPPPESTVAEPVSPLLEGPLALIHHFETTGIAGKFKACAEDRTLIMIVSEQGARDLIKLNPAIAKNSNTIFRLLFE